MSSNSVNLGAGYATGMFYRAPAGTALPDFPADTLATGWVEVGAVSADGITWATSHDFEALKNWANALERMLPSEDSGTVQAPIIDTTEASLKTIFGENNVTKVAATTSHGSLISVDVSNDTAPGPAAYLFIGKDGDDMFMLGTTKGFLQTLDDITFAPNEPITWTATIAATTWTFMKDDGQVTSTPPTPGYDPEED